VFTHYFSEDGSRLIELYNAVVESDYPSDTPLELNTLSGVLYLDQLNDISFLLDDRLVILVEHQSTINENMPFRMLSYMTRVLEQYTKEMDRYGKKRFSLPRPEFITIYDGVEDYPSETTLLLSDAFKEDSKGLTALELVVKVVNINHGKADAVLERSNNLSQFSAFVEVVRFFRDNAGPDERPAEVFRKAINYCIKHGIMAEYLQIHATEVNNMLITEWDQEIADRVRYAEGKEDGVAEGIAVGIAEGKAELVAAMASHGLSAEQIAEFAGLPIEEIKGILLGCEAKA
jgi:hypothetical protein